MKKQNGIAFAAFILIAAGSVAEAEAKDTRQSDTLQVADQRAELATSSQAVQDQVDLSCTFYCSLWNICLVKNPGDMSRCGAEPEGCQCREFE